MALLYTSSFPAACLRLKRGRFLTWAIWEAPLKIKILKSDFLHAREDQKIGPEPNFHESRSSNDLD